MKKYLFPLATVCAALFFLAACQQTKSERLVARELRADSLPAIKNLKELRLIGRQLFLTFDYIGGYGEQVLQSYRLDTADFSLHFEREYLRRADGGRQLFAPILFQGEGDTLLATGADEPDVLRLRPDGVGERTGDCLIPTNAVVPYPIAQRVMHAFYHSPKHYYFLGRAPQGGAQALFLSDTRGDSVVISEVRKIIYRPEKPSWITNFGKIVYDRATGTAVFAYTMYPVLQRFDLSDGTVFTLSAAENVPPLVEGADLWEQNPVYFQDIAASRRHIYALYWGRKASDPPSAQASAASSAQFSSAPACQILRFDHNLRLSAAFPLDIPLTRIAACDDDNLLIGYGEGKFYLLQRSQSEESR